MYAGEGIDPISLFKTKVFGSFGQVFNKGLSPKSTKVIRSKTDATQKKDFDFDSTHLLLPNSASAASVSNTVRSTLEGNAIRLRCTTKRNPYGLPVARNTMTKDRTNNTSIAAMQ